MSLPLWWALLLAGAPDDARDAMREGTLDEARERVTLFVLAGGSWSPYGKGKGNGGYGFGNGYYTGGGDGDGNGYGNGNGNGTGYGDGDGTGYGIGGGSDGDGFGFGGGFGNGYGDGGTGILEVTHGGRTWTPRQVLEALLEATG